MSGGEPADSHHHPSNNPPSSEGFFGIKDVRLLVFQSSSNPSSLLFDSWECFEFSKPDPAPHSSKTPAGIGFSPSVVHRIIFTSMPFRHTSDFIRLRRIGRNLLWIRSAGLFSSEVSRLQQQSRVVENKTITPAIDVKSSTNNFIDDKPVALDDPLDASPSSRKRANTWNMAKTPTSPTTPIRTQTIPISHSSSSSSRRRGSVSSSSPTTTAAHDLSTHLRNSPSYSSSNSVSSAPSSSASLNMGFVAAIVVAGSTRIQEQICNSISLFDPLLVCVLRACQNVFQRSFSNRNSISTPTRTSNNNKSMIPESPIRISSLTPLSSTASSVSSPNLMSNTTTTPRHHQSLTFSPQNSNSASMSRSSVKHRRYGSDSTDSLVLTQAQSSSNPSYNSTPFLALSRAASLPQSQDSSSGGSSSSTPTERLLGESQLFIQRAKDLLFSLVRFITTPRLKYPTWLSCGAMPDERLKLSTHFISSISRLVETKARENVLVSFLTSLLIHSPFWVSSILPHNKGNRNRVCFQHPMQPNVFSTGDFCRIVIVGENSLFVNDMITVATYFHRVPALMRHVTSHDKEGVLYEPSVELLADTKLKSSDSNLSIGSLSSRLTSLIRNGELTSTGDASPSTDSSLLAAASKDVDVNDDEHVELGKEDRENIVTETEIAAKKRIADLQRVYRPITISSSLLPAWVGYLPSGYCSLFDVQGVPKFDFMAGLVIDLGRCVRTSLYVSGASSSSSSSSEQINKCTTGDSYSYGRKAHALVVDLDRSVSEVLSVPPQPVGALGQQVEPKKLSHRSSFSSPISLRSANRAEWMPSLTTTTSSSASSASLQHSSSSSLQGVHVVHGISFSRFRSSYSNLVSRMVRSILSIGEVSAVMNTLEISLGYIREMGLALAEHLACLPESNDDDNLKSGRAKIELDELNDIFSDENSGDFLNEMDLKLLLAVAHHLRNFSQ